MPYGVAGKGGADDLRRLAPMGPGAVGWQISGMNGPVPFQGAAQFYSIGVLEDPNADYHTMDEGVEVGGGMVQERKFLLGDSDGVVNAQRGKKLLIYHSLSDPLISPLKHARLLRKRNRASQAAPGPICGAG